MAPPAADDDRPSSAAEAALCPSDMERTEKWVPAFAGTTVGVGTCMSSQLTLIGLAGIPMVQSGDDLGAITMAGFAATGITPEDGDVLVVAQKIVSKAENRFVDVSTVEPSDEAIALAPQVEKDPRLVQVVLSESRRIVRHRPNLMIAEHRLGYVMANAGIDHSNVAPSDGTERVLLLPVDPDASAEALRQQLLELCGKRIAVIISDSFGRPFRRGTVGIALGAAGLPAVIAWCGHADLFEPRVGGIQDG